jgi:solute carrier family 50 protein (sugar transporter)
MKSFGTYTAMTLAVVGGAPSQAWIGRRLFENPRSNHVKNRHPARLIDVEGFNKVRGGDSTLLKMLPNPSLEVLTSPLVLSLIPKIGIITSTLVYFSPMAAVRAASMNRSLEDLNPSPLVIMSVSSICWLAYGLSVRDPFVTLSNVPGSIASIWYVTAVLPLLSGRQLQTTQNTIVLLTAMTINLWTYLSLSNKPMVQVRSMLGLFASALFVVLSGSPLSTITTVLKTRNSGSILTKLTMAQITNTALWSAYGLAIKDKFVYGPNLIGLFFGLAQLVLKITFPSK